MEGTLNVVGYGLSAIGPGIGVGIMFAAWMTATARQPESAGVTRPMLFMGFALVEVMMLFGLVLAFILPV